MYTSYVPTGDRGDLLQPRAGEGAVRHRDVRDGRQHARQDRGVQRHQEARRERLQVFIHVSRCRFLFRAPGGCGWLGPCLGNLRALQSYTLR